MIKYSGYDRTVPIVTFDCKELEGFMYDFMMENINGNRFVDMDKSINEYVGLVMLRLGFKSDDKIELRDVSVDILLDVAFLVSEPGEFIFSVASASNF